MGATKNTDRIRLFQIVDFVDLIVEEKWRKFLRLKHVAGTCIQCFNFEFGLRDYLQFDVFRIKLVYPHPSLLNSNGAGRFADRIFIILRNADIQPVGSTDWKFAQQPNLRGLRVNVKFGGITSWLEHREINKMN